MKSREIHYVEKWKQTRIFKFKHSYRGLLVSPRLSTQIFRSSHHDFPGGMEFSSHFITIILLLKQLHQVLVVCGMVRTLLRHVSSHRQRQQKRSKNFTRKRAQRNGLIQISPDVSPSVLIQREHALDNVNDNLKDFHGGHSEMPLTRELLIRK